MITLFNVSLTSGNKFSSKGQNLITSKKFDFFPLHVRTLCKILTTNSPAMKAEVLVETLGLQNI